MELTGYSVAVAVLGAGDRSRRRRSAPRPSGKALPYFVFQIACMLLLIGKLTISDVTLEQNHLAAGRRARVHRVLTTFFTNALSDTADLAVAVLLDMVKARSVLGVESPATLDFRARRGVYAAEGEHEGEEPGRGHGRRCGLQPEIRSAHRCCSPFATNLHHRPPNAAALARWVAAASLGVSRPLEGRLQLR